MWSWLFLLFFVVEAYVICVFFFFFQAEDGIRDLTVTGVQTCALPILCNTVAYANMCLNVRFWPDADVQNYSKFIYLNQQPFLPPVQFSPLDVAPVQDRKSTRLNSSHSQISYAVFCLKKKKKNYIARTYTCMFTYVVVETGPEASTGGYCGLLV